MYPQALPNQIQSLMENTKQNSALKTRIIISKGTLFGLVTLLTAWTVPEINGAYTTTTKQECYTIGGEGGSGAEGGSSEEGGTVAMA